ncbi:SulP family inorganic anion transporter [Crenobacter intestini]|uniref:STAS domain-containing protein n=1 Tax=Crenobacter intestini TaxID=2563443 RepID=A0A4T0URD8_9NEIS|nr:SulP family inorganic anion transporter [Crenobacter intestini]TIC81181.1 STAS domain-containing protein [Crenobacter intestini]
MRAVPLPPWLAGYRREFLAGDLVAGVVVTLLLVPQALAYALVAGLPAEVGLYASLAPLVIYALAGRSHAQSVGPMAVTSLLVASTLARLAPAGSAEYLLFAIWLALLSGLMLVLLGAFRLGLVADFLSQPVLAGFVSASALMIVLSQLAPLAGVAGGGATLPAQLSRLAAALQGGVSAPALWLGGAALAWLLWARASLAATLARAGVPVFWATLAERAAPVAALAGGVLAVRGFDLAGHVALVGVIPAGLPAPSLVLPAFAELSQLVLPAFFIALVNTVQSLSVAQLLAARRGERLDPDRELLALGLCNLGAGLSGGFPVTGGLTRSIVNADAGANTQLSSLFSALLMLAIVLFATGALAELPLAVLAATIVASVWKMVDFSLFARAWRSRRADAAAFGATFAAVLLLGVDSGIVVGLLVSLGAWIAGSGKPHIAEVGRIAGSEHFRNVARFAVERLPGVRFVRVDESLYFGNARNVDTALRALAADARVLVLIMSGVNRVDLSALMMLEALDDALAARGIALWLSDVKGPVAGVLGRAGSDARFAGRTCLSANDAWTRLSLGADYQI